ncbi:MAG: hypothetical protein IJN62_02965 [Clostridia bacterium]|nr:hypothetical protein [Clostridia bacterium]
MKKEKITNFSDFVYYYKWHVIIAVVLVIVLASSLHSCATKVEDDLVVSVLISNYASADASENIASDLCAAGIIPDIDGDGISKTHVNIVTLPLETQTEADVAAGYQAMIAMAADDSMLFLVDEDLLEMYESQGAFDDISDKAEKYGFSEEDVYIAEDGTLMGLSLKGNEYLESKGMVTDTLYACFRPLPEGELESDMIAKIKAADDILEFIIK